MAQPRFVVCETCGGRGCPECANSPDCAPGVRDTRPETRKVRAECDHGVTFDVDAARVVLGEWSPNDTAEFIVGNPKVIDVRRRWPRLDGACPKGCGYVGIAYASVEHYTMGDW